MVVMCIREKKRPAFVQIIAILLALTLYMKGVSYIGPERGILYGFSEPLIAAVIGVVFFKNPFTIADTFGFACIFAMLFLITKIRKRFA